SDGEAKLGIADRIARGLGLRAWSMPAALIPDAAAERDRLARMWERECVLGGAVLVLLFDDALEPSRRRAGIAWLDRFRAAVIVCARDSVPLGCRPVRTAEVERPVREEQRVLWQRSLGNRAVAFNGQLDRVVGQFSLDAAAIARISATVKEAD